MNEPITAVEKALCALENGEIKKAEKIISEDYPFKPFTRYTRSYTMNQKMIQFKKDGFIDRYSGEKLINPGVLKVLSYYLPAGFPYQKNWKMSECHIGYWELCPTIDHILPIAMGGRDEPENWATTSMLNNSIKSNWTLEQMRWSLYEAGDFNAWDGLTNQFVSMVQNTPELMEDLYIKNWYKASLYILQRI